MTAFELGDKVVCTYGTKWHGVIGVICNTIAHNKYVFMVNFAPGADLGTTPDTAETGVFSSGDLRILADDEVRIGAQVGEHISEVHKRMRESTVQRINPGFKVLDESAPFTEADMRKVRAPGSLLQPGAYVKRGDEVVHDAARVRANSGDGHDARCAWCREGIAHTDAEHTAEMRMYRATGTGGVVHSAGDAPSTVPEGEQYNFRCKACRQGKPHIVEVHRAGVLRGTELTQNLIDALDGATAEQLDYIRSVLGR